MGRTYGSITIVDTTDIERVYMVYAGSNSDTQAPDKTNFSLWKTDVTQVTGTYIWQRTVIKKSGINIDSSNFQSYYGEPVCVTGPEGGVGNPGKSVESITTSYCNYGSGTPAANSNRWQSSVPAYNSNYPNYWVKIVITYSNPTDSNTKIYKDNGITDAIKTSYDANTTAGAAKTQAETAERKANNAINTAGEAKTIAEGASSGVTALQTKTKYFWINPVAHTNGNDGWTKPNYPVGTYAASGISGTTFDEENSSTYGYNTLYGNGIKLRYNAFNWGELTGSKLLFYRPSLTSQGKKAMELDSSALKFYDANENMIASYGDKIVLGKKTSSASTFSRAEFEFNSMKLYAKGDSVPYFWVEDKRNENGVATTVESFTVNTEDTEFNIIKLNYALKTFVTVYVDNNDITQVSAYGLYQDSMYKVQFDPSLFSEGTTHTISIEYTTEDAITSMTFGSRDSSIYGPYSFSEGEFNIASGTCSHAEGRTSTASGHWSHAEGFHTTASGNMSHAEGFDSVASGHISHAEGQHTTASGQNSHAEGTDSIASGWYSHSEGIHTIASKNCSHAEGYYTIASNLYSHAEGNNTEASGLYSHAEGFNTTASGSGSHSEGVNTTASGRRSSHAEGYNSYANNMGSHAEGGYYDDSSTINLTGNANATTYTINSISIVDSSIATNLIGLYICDGPATSIRIRVIDQTITNGVVTSITLSETLSASAISDHQYYLYGGTVASGYSSHSEGVYTFASGNYSHAEGILVNASGEYSHAQNEGTIAQGQSQTVIGKYNIAQGTNSSIANTDYAFIIGNGTSSNPSNALTVDWNGVVDAKNGYKINSTAPMIIESVSEDNITINANSIYTWNKTGLTKDGYTFAGIVGFYVANATTSGVNSSICNVYYCHKYNDTSFYMNIRNTGSASSASANTYGAAKVKLMADILWIANGML